MKLLLNIHHQLPYHPCGAAYIELTPDLAAKILKRRGILNAMLADDAYLESMHYAAWGEVEYLGNVKGDFLANVDDCDNVGYCELDKEPNFDPNAAAADRDGDVIGADNPRIAIFADHVCWIALVGDQQIETTDVDYDLIRRAQEKI